jgi:AP endonuclease 2
VILEFPAFVLLGVYSPANRDSSRDGFRISFLEALDIRIRNLVAAGKQVVLTGDLNVIRSENDVANVVEHLRKEGLSVDDFLAMPARRLFNQLVFEGHVAGGPRDEGREEPVLWDLCRLFHPVREGMYTCWDTKRNTRPANNGSRIDYILCTAGIKDWFSDANIQEGLMGSDHCPVFANLTDKVTINGEEVHLADVMNPKGMFRGGKRVREWSQKDLLPMSARLIPEFDKRRSIREMFLKKPSATRPEPSSNLSNKDPAVPSSTEDAAAAAVMVETPKTGSPRSISEVPDAQASQYSTRSESVAASPARKIESPAKRPPDSPALAKRPQKKTKTAVETEGNAKANNGLSQSTLKGFFRPKQPTALAATSGSKEKNTAQAAAMQAVISEKEKVEIMSASALTAVESPTPKSEEDERVFDPIQAKESWSKLLGKRVVPRCEHNEPCISLLTKKPGVNCGKSAIIRSSHKVWAWPRPSLIYPTDNANIPPGRSFYICPRPLGPSGEKEKGTQWRCGTFIWSSEWSGSQI